MTATIRPATEADAAAVAAIYASFCEASPVSFEEVAPSAAEMAGRVCKILEQFPWLVLDDGGTVAGYTYASKHRERAAYRWSVDTTVYVAGAYRRRGVGRALYTALLPLLRLQGYFKAFAGVTLPNPGSVGLHTAVGFAPVGVYHGVGYKHGAWHDVGWFQLELQLQRPAPEPPRIAAAVVGSPEWHAALANGLKYYRRDAQGHSGRAV
jgi:L-amino acid N-acyltransferase YncA